MSSEYYASWVERHKHEDEDGNWWWEEVGVLIAGPYTEDVLDKVLWDAALAGDASPSPP